MARQRGGWCKPDRAEILEEGIEYMPTSVAIPVSEYLATSYRPDCDYLDGELVERNVGEFDHSRLQGLLTRSLMNREQEWGILVVPEQRLR